MARKNPRPLFAVLAAYLGAAFLNTATADSLLIDFSRNDGSNGNDTSSPDTNGNYWNNIAVTTGTVPANQLTTNLVTVGNSPTTVSVQMSAGWDANGRNNGGLLAPDPALLGEFAIGTATEDYYFLGAGTPVGTLTIKGLTPGITYDLDLFGTRNSGSNRVTGYSVTDIFGTHSETLQTSGTGAGAAGSLGNDDDIISLTGLVPNENNELVLTVSIEDLSSAFAYLGIMRITEGGPIPPPPNVLIDFGRDGTNGNATVNPDANGNYWNNLASINQGGVPTTLEDLITDTNGSTAINLTMSAGWQANGGSGFGGLLSPDPLLLGEFAVSTVTEDYYFVDGGTDTRTITISGLTQGIVYDFSMFATRNTPETRTTGYSVTDASGTHFTTLQTSGTGAGAAGSTGNDDTIAMLEGLIPNSSGEIVITVSSEASQFAYIGGLKIEPRNPKAPLPPPPGSISYWVEQDALDPVAPGSVLFVGSSSIRRWEALTKDFADYRVTQRGFGGSQLPELNAVADYIVHPYEPSAIVMWEGTNDVKAAGRTGAQVNADFETFVGLVRENQPSIPIFFLGIAPTPGYGTDPDADVRRRDTNTLISATCAEDPTLYYIDLPSFFENIQDNFPSEFQSYYSDNTHFSKKGYDEWTKIIRPQIEAVIPPNKVFVANPSTPVAGESILFDFGPSDGSNGDPTEGADGRGNIWNNWHPINGGGTVHSGEHLAGLVKTNGDNAGIRMTITAGFLVNGKQNGGLFAPDETLLGNLAVETATEDYFFSNGDDLYDQGNDDVPGGFMLDGLNPSMAYEIRLFGTRATTETRITEYDVSGLNEKIQNLQTSGTDIGSNGAYDGNDDEVLVLSGLVPDAFGQLFFDLTVVESQFAYLGAMEIKATSELAAIDLWRTGEFTSAELEDPALESTLWGNDADPDFDGRNNLLEYATGTQAQLNDPSVIIGGMERIGEDDLLTLTYQKNLAATDVSYQVEASDNLIFTEDIADTFVSAAGGYEIRKASVATAGIPARFLRLKVEQIGIAEP